VVCANLSSDLLIAERERIVSVLARDGILVLAGILKSEFPEIKRAYTSAGLKQFRSRREGDWHCGCFRFAETGAA
jgi:ribosomal protein L11 methylase PrmA